jgi:serine/threonine protein kinase
MSEVGHSVFLQGIDDWQSVATVMKEVLKALEYMHDRGRVHRDVKVTAGWHLRLSKPWPKPRFGLS